MDQVELLCLATLAAVIAILYQLWNRRRGARGAATAADDARQRTAPGGRRFTFRHGHFPDIAARLEPLRAFLPANPGIKVRTCASGVVASPHVDVFNFHFTSGTGEDEISHNQTGALVHVDDWQLPTFAVAPDSAFQRLSRVWNDEDIELPALGQLSVDYLIRARDPSGLRALIKSSQAGQLAEAIRQLPKLRIYGAGSQLLVYKLDQQLPPKSWTDFAKHAAKIAKLLGTEPKGWGRGLTGEFQVVDDTAQMP